MSALLIILAAIAILVAGYVTYGSWLARQWGIDATRKTPARTMEDGVDYVAAPPAVLMGHHFSSVAGAGPINGPIQASVFGWLPVFLWCVFGGIFFGGLQDFGSLFASIRNNGKSIGEIIRSSMGERAKRLFIVFALLVLILVIASFVNVVAGTFMSAADETGQVPFGFTARPDNNQATAMISLLFIFLAVCYGVLTNRFGVKTGPATVLGIAGVAGIVALGLNVGFAMSRTAWIVLIGLYITVASLLPVWIMLQPRDYLSSFLLYAMIAISLCGITYAAFSHSAQFRLPAFTGWRNASGALFPTLFITIACGACSGFHSLIATGTSSKQLDAEAHAKPIAYGSMLIESALGVISLIAVGMISTGYTAELGSPATAFANGIAAMFHGSSVVAALLTLAVSVFALTSLDSSTRLARFMFSELFLREGEASWRDAKGFRRWIAHPLVGTLLMVVVGCVLGGLSLSQIWGLFGAANQLLAGIALMAVCSWLGSVGKNNRMFYFPMAFMLTATQTSLIMTIVKKIGMIGAGAAAWGDWFQLLFALAMSALAVILVIEAIGTLARKRAARA